MCPSPTPLPHPFPLPLPLPHPHPHPPIPCRVPLLQDHDAATYAGKILVRALCFSTISYGSTPHETNLDARCVGCCFLRTQSCRHTWQNTQRLAVEACILTIIYRELKEGQGYFAGWPNQVLKSGDWVGVCEDSVSFVSNSGYNQKDSLVMNRASLERGMFRSEHIRRYKADVGSQQLSMKKHKSKDNVNFGKTQGKIGRFGSVIGRFSDSGVDHSVKLKHTERGMVQKVVLTANDEGKNFAVVSLRQRLDIWMCSGSVPLKLKKDKMAKIAKCSESMWKLTYCATVESCILMIIYLGKNGAALGGTGWAITQFGWDVKYAGVQTIVAKTTVLSSLVMADDKSTSNPPTENSNSNQDGDITAESGASINALARQVQESLSLSKKHTFWETQPVGQLKDLGDSSLPEGPIKPYNLPGLYEWVTCDMESEAVCTEVYTLLTNNYVEDDENMFRFNYSKEFLQWTIRPPGYFRSWHIGVRVKSSKKLVAFITGIPARMRARDSIVNMAEINFLCVHKKLRSKRLAPDMIKEVTRRVDLENMWQAAYTAGVVLPTPIATCQYWHRSLNPKKLIDVGFSRLGARMTMSRTIKLYKLPDSTVTQGFRKMERHDIKAVTQLLRII